MNFIATTITRLAAVAPLIISFASLEANAGSPQTQLGDISKFGWLRSMIAPDNAVVIVFEEHGRIPSRPDSISAGNVSVKVALLRNLMRTGFMCYTKSDSHFSGQYHDLQSATNIVFTYSLPTNLPVVSVIESWSSRGDYATMNGMGSPVSIFNLSATLRVTDAKGKLLLERAYTEGEYKSSYANNDALPSAHARKAIIADVTRGAVRYTPLIPNRDSPVPSLENATIMNGRLTNILHRVAGFRLDSGGFAREIDSSAKIDSRQSQWEQNGDVIRVWTTDGSMLFEGRIAENTVKGLAYSTFGGVHDMTYEFRKD